MYVGVWHVQRKHITLFKYSFHHTHFVQLLCVHMNCKEYNILRILMFIHYTIEHSISANPISMLKGWLCIIIQTIVYLKHDTFTQLFPCAR